MASTLGSILQKKAVGVRTLLLASSPPQISINKGLNMENFIQDSWVNEGGDFIQREVFQALTRGEEKPKVGIT